MNINFGIITPLGYKVKGKRNKNAEISRRRWRSYDGDERGDHAVIFRPR